jgi:hypothetical protein
MPIEYLQFCKPWFSLFEERLNRFLDVLQSATSLARNYRALHVHGIPQLGILKPFNQRHIGKAQDIPSLTECSLE